MNITDWLKQNATVVARTPVGQFSDGYTYVMTTRHFKDEQEIKEFHGGQDYAFLEVGNSEDGRLYVRSYLRGIDD